MKKRARFLFASIAASLTLALVPTSGLASEPRMTCSEPFEAVCVAIGTACRALDTVESKVLDKDLINCQLG